MVYLRPFMLCTHGFLDNITFSYNRPLWWCDAAAVPSQMTVGTKTRRDLCARVPWMEYMMQHSFVITAKITFN